MKDWEKASRCKRPGRYVTPMATETWRFNEQEGGEPLVGWERWDDAWEDWIPDTPDTLLHYVPPAPEVTP